MISSSTETNVLKQDLPFRCFTKAQELISLRRFKSRLDCPESQSSLLHSEHVPRYRSPWGSGQFMSSSYIGTSFRKSKIKRMSNSLMAELFILVYKIDSLEFVYTNS